MPSVAIIQQPRRYYSITFTLFRGTLVNKKGRNIRFSSRLLITMNTIWSVTILLLVPYFACSMLAIPEGGLDCKPFAVRLNLGIKFHNEASPEMLGVRFNTRLPCESSYIMFRKSFSLLSKIPCRMVSFTLGSYNGYIHKCSIMNITYGESFSYMPYGWSGQGVDQPIAYNNTFINSHLLSNKTQMKLVVLADWGFLKVKAGVYDPLETAFSKMIDINQKIDAIYIGGDIAYDLDSYEGEYYEDFIIMLSQAACRWPLILNTGNHEHLTIFDEQILEKTFEVYGSVRSRLTVINLPHVSWFMLDPYLIALKGEDPAQLTLQFEQKLKQLYQISPQKPVIACSHYPYRCNGNIPDCFDLRQRLNPLFLKMMQYNVALYIGAHYHTYERVHPYFYNETFVNKPSPYVWTEGGEANYLDNTLLSIVEGIAGNDRQIIMTYPPEEEFTAAYVISNTGFGIMTLQSQLLSYDHVLHNDPFTPKDSWKILFVKKFQHKRLSLRRQ